MGLRSFDLRNVGRKGGMIGSASTSMGLRSFDLRNQQMGVALVTVEGDFNGAEVFRSQKSPGAGEIRLQLEQLQWG